MATKTAIIVLCEEAVLIWAIPLLLPEPPDFSDYNPIHIPPLFRIAFPEGIVHHAAVKWQMTSSWYFASSHPLYFDILCQDSKRHRFRIVIEPDLSDASLEILNTSELSPLSFDNRIYRRHNICEDTLVCCWRDNANSSHYGAYIGLMSPRFAPAVIVSLPATRRDYGHSACPASGRFVYLERALNGIVVHDFL